MIKYTDGLKREYKDLAIDFFTILNPKSKTGFTTSSIIHRLNKSIQEESGSVKVFLQYFADHNYKLLHKIITAEPEILEDTANELEKKRVSLGLEPFSVSTKTGALKASDFGKKIYEIFDYDSFRQSSKCDWLLNEIFIPVCPYCNREVTISVRDSRSKKKHLLDIDHYFSKARYPFLSLSFYNLIPACHVCNSRYKGTKEFSLKTHTHPYIDSFHNYFRFESTITNYSDNNFRIYLQKKEGINNKDCERGKRIIEDLGLEEVYDDDIYRKEVARITEVMDKYPYEQIHYLTELTISGIKIFAEQSLDYSRDYSLMLNENEIRTTPIGKLKFDTAEPLKAPKSSLS